MGVLLHWTQANSFELIVHENMGIRRVVEMGISPAWKLGLRTKFSKKRDVSNSILLHSFISCNDSLLAGTTTHTAQCRTSERYFTKGYEQGHNDVGWGPGQEASLAPQCSNLRSFCAAVEKDDHQFWTWSQKKLAQVLSFSWARVWRTSCTLLS